MKESVIREVIQAHNFIHLGGYITDLIYLDGACLTYGREYTGIWFSNASDIQVEPDRVDDLIDQIEAHMTSRGCTPAINVTPATRPADLGERLLKRGYKVAKTVAWMCANYSKQPQPFTLPANVTIYEAKTQADIETFTSIYRTGYPDASAAKEAEAFIASFKYSQSLIDVRYLIVTYHGEPVGIVLYRGLGQHASQGTGMLKKELRGSEIFPAIVYYSNAIGLQQGVKYLFNQALADTNLERRYVDFGLERQFIRTCYVLGEAAA